jgi:dTDP-4-amino-4,6-dideoxygalactose transaminase
MSKKNEIPSAKPVFDESSIESILSDIREILKSGLLAESAPGAKSPHVKNFEKMFAEYVDTKEAIAVSCGTAALEIPLRHFGIKGGEVIVPTNTFIASANAVLYAGGKPVLADIDAKTLCIDPNDAQNRINSKTRGIIVVHIGGLVCPQIRELQEICEDHRLFLIEDAAHAQGAAIDGKKAGSLGDVGSFSFFPTKVMTTCEGGMITTDNLDLARQARRMRNHGRDEKTGLVVTLGYNWLMDEIRAVIGINQLRQLERFVERRNEIAKKYNEGLEKMECVEPVFTPSNIRNSYYKYPVYLDEEIDVSKLTQFLRREHHISLGNIYYPPCHLMPLYKEMFGYKGGELPVSEQVLKRVITLPMHVQLSDTEISRVLDGLAKGLESLRT